MRSRPEKLVAHGYDRVADAYAALEGESEWPRMRGLEDLLRRLPPHARVLDLGCGSGVPATRAILDRGHAALAVDVSVEQLDRARRNVPEAELVQATALELELRASIHDWLREGGWLLLTFETGDQPGVVGEWLGARMFFSHFDSQTNERLVREAGFDVVRAEDETQLEGGRSVPYLWVLARKRRRPER